MARTPETTEAPTTADLAAQLEELKADLAQITETLTALGKAKGEAAVDAAKAEVDQLRKKGEEQIQNLQAQASQLACQANEMIRQNPGAAMGVAAGLGFFFGLLLVRK